MGPFTSISIYLIAWWLIFLMILPLGSKSFHEAGLDPGPGCDPGAPVLPNMKKKLITTTWVSAILFAIFWLLVHFHVISMPGVAQVY